MNRFALAVAALVVSAGPALGQGEPSGPAAAAAAAIAGSGLFEPIGGRVSGLWPAPAVAQAVAASEAAAPTESELLKAKNEVQAAIANLKSMLADPSLSAENKVKVYESLVTLQSALERINQTLASGQREARIDQTIAEARLIQRVMSGYFGAKGTFGYELRRGGVEVEVGADAIYDIVSRKLPFLRGAVGGRVRINPGNEAVNQFNALKAEYYGALLEAAHIDKKDSRLKALASWGRDTNVIYPGATFGQPILDGRQYFELQ